MSRLVTFGCSLTYGSALENPNDAWPKQLASKWNLDLVNMGISGISTKRIWWEIINFEFEKTDTVIVLWTHMDRWGILKEDGDHFQWDIPGKIIWYPSMPPVPPLEKKTAEAYYKYLHDDFDMLTQYLCYVNQAHEHMKPLVEQQYHVRASQQDLTLPFNRVNFLPIDFQYAQTNFPLATDDCHPGKEGYAWFVEKIDECVNRKGVRWKINTPVNKESI